jgi:hypothetical protein|tara:strand:- start:635 stop:838 length:204 start_codon:yes stop_codon:yes gene_type:complete
MFIIVQDILNVTHNEVEDFDCFDILTTPTGFPMKFNTEGEALKFLNGLGLDEMECIEQGEIRIDRVH